MACTKPISTVRSNCNNRLCSKVFSMSARARVFIWLKQINLWLLHGNSKTQSEILLGFFSGWLSHYCDINIFNWSPKPSLPMLPLSLYLKQFPSKVISVLYFNIFQQWVEKTETAVGHRCWCLKWFISPLVPLAKWLTFYAVFTISESWWVFG